MTRVTGCPIMLGVSRFRPFEPIKYYATTTTGKHVQCEQRVAYLQTTLIDRRKDRKDRQKDYHKPQKKVGWVHVNSYLPIHQYPRSPLVRSAKSHLPNSKKAKIQDKTQGVSKWTQVPYLRVTVKTVGYPSGY